MEIRSLHLLCSIHTLFALRYFCSLYLHPLVVGICVDCIFRLADTYCGSADCLLETHALFRSFSGAQAKQSEGQVK